LFSFFLPTVFHRFLEDGRLNRILNDLNNVIVVPETRSDIYGDIGDFLRMWYNHQTWWAVKLVLCDVLNMINIIINVLLVDWYMGGMFFDYGVVSMEVNDIALLFELDPIALFTFSTSPRRTRNVATTRSTWSSPR
jgi:hypothetical protein